MRVVNKYRESYTHYIGRGSAFGNPFTHLTGRTKATYVVATRLESIRAFEAWAMDKNPKFMCDEHEALWKAVAALPEDAVLGCFCKPAACHGDVIVKMWESLRK